LFPIKIAGRIFVKFCE